MSKIIQSFEAKELKKRSWSVRLADDLTSVFGSFLFLTLNVIFFILWILANKGLISGVTPFDPFPFGLLTMAVSLEAIMLAVIILISQNRQGKIADIRQKMDFEIDVRAEEETTKILQMLEDIKAHNRVKLRADADLKRMERPTDIEKVREALEAEEGAEPR